METNNFNGKIITRPRIEAFLDKSIDYKITFVSADIGWGKTISVYQWVSKQSMPISWIDISINIQSQSMEWLKKLEEAEASSDIIVIDDYQLLIGTDNYETTIRLIENSKPSCRFIIISRSVIPDELRPYADALQLQLITENELAYTETEIKDYFIFHNYELDDKTIMTIKKETEGRGLALSILLYTVKVKDGNFGADIFINYKEELFSYFDRNLYTRWTLSERRFFMIISLLDDFSIDLAASVSGMEECSEIIHRYSKGTKQIIKVQPNIYRLNSFLKRYIEERRLYNMPPEEMNEILQKAGAWYEAVKDMSKAFDCYSRIGSFKKMIQLLEESSERYLYTVNFDELERFYMVLPTDIILKSPILCSNMVMLHSICYRMEEAKEWFRRLLSMRDNITESDHTARKALEERIIYTSLILPEVSGRRLIRILKDMKHIEIMKSPLMQRTSLTGHIPSVLRGYKDLSAWSDHAKDIKAYLGPMIEALFKDQAVGTVNISYAEALYEKNQLSAALIEVTKGINEVELRGTPEMMYAGYTILAKIMAAYGQIDTSHSIMENVLNKINHSNAFKLLPNYRATMARFDILSDNEEQAAEWLKEYSPDLKAGFRIFFCYQYLTKVKIYLQLGLYPQAIADLERLCSFYTDYKRPLDLSESLLLQAIAFDRVGDEELAMERLEKALSLAQRHNFIRVFADEGDAGYKLLLKYSRLGRTVIKGLFLKNVIEASKQFALMYPHYLVIMKEEAVVLTKTETEILLLLERGMSNGEIAKFLIISVDTVKFHTKNIYSKLNVKSRMQAVILAKRYKII